MDDMNSYMIKVGDVVEVITDIWGKKLFGRKYKVTACHPSSNMFHTQDGSVFYKDENNDTYKVVEKRKRKIG